MLDEINYRIKNPTPCWNCTKERKCEHYDKRKMQIKEYEENVDKDIRFEKLNICPLYDVKVDMDEVNENIQWMDSVVKKRNDEVELLKSFISMISEPEILTLLYRSAYNEVKKEFGDNICMYSESTDYAKGICMTTILCYFNKNIHISSRMTIKVAEINDKYLDLLEEINSIKYTGVDLIDIKLRSGYNNGNSTIYKPRTI